MSAATSQAFDQSILRPGDFILYRPKPHNMIGLWIALKTWSWIAHVECYKGGGMSLASRDGIGVNCYPFREAQIGLVRRPKQVPNIAKGLKYFDSVKGQGYDFLGLCCFYLAVRQGSPNKQFCSEFCHNLAKEMDLNLFDPDLVPDHTAPAQFDQTPALDTVWRDSPHWTPTDASQSA